MLNIFKTAAANSKKHQNYKFWQNEYHPIELFTNEMMDQKLDYVHANPVKDGLVERPKDYLYTSVQDYCGMKGMLEIEFMN
jgi:putative transposase